MGGTWVIPRDDVEIHTVYMQRGGHLVMSELQNDGSRAIRDVVLEVQFLDAQDDLIQTMRIEVDTVKAHSSLAGDDLEMIVLGYTVWEEYTLKISVRYTMFDNSQNFMEVNRCRDICFGSLCRSVETTTRLF